MVCDGVTCLRYKAKKPKGMGRYASGQSRCQTCVLFMYWNGDRCPCCETKLRKNPRSAKYKTKLRENEREHYGVKYDKS